MPSSAAILRSASFAVTGLAVVLASPAFAQDAAQPYGPPVSQTTEQGTTTLSPRADGFDVTFQDLRGVTTRYAYDAAGLLASETAPEIGRLRFDHDDQGRPVRRASADGLVARVEYDDSGRLLRKAYRSDGPRGMEDRIVTRYGYDVCENGAGKLCRIVHNGHVTRFAYTPDGRLASKAVRLADETDVERLRYDYDADGRLDRMRYPSGLVVRHHYDADGRLVRLTGHYETGEDRARFTIARDIAFDADGRLSGFVHGNGVRTRLRRGDGGALSRITLAKDGTVLDRADLARDTDGRVTAIDRPDDVRDRRFAYDAGGRLVMETTGDGTPTATTRIDYAYDAVHNRTSATQGTATRHYTYASDSNRLTAIGRQSVSYDERGNLTSDRSRRRSFTYDATNRMVAFMRDGELRATYDYDAHGRRIRKRLHRPDADGVRSVRFVHDTDGRLVSEVSRRDDRAAVHARDLVWLGGLPLAQVERKVRSDGTTRQASVLSLHAGHLGEPREARDKSGTVVWRWEGDAFGHGPVRRDPDDDGVSTEVSLRFPGQYHDRESGLFYNHHRDYDPKLGRYVQSDPIGLKGGVNRYAYVSGDPVNWVDPNGMKQCWYTWADPDSDGGAGTSIILTNCTSSVGGEDGVAGGGGGGGGIGVGGGAPNPGPVFGEGGGGNNNFDPSKSMCVNPSTNLQSTLDEIASRTSNDGNEHGAFYYTRNGKVFSTPIFTSGQPNTIDPSTYIPHLQQLSLSGATIIFAIHSHPYLRILDSHTNTYNRTFLSAGDIRLFTNLPRYNINVERNLYAALVGHPNGVRIDSFFQIDLNANQVNRIDTCD